MGRMNITIEDALGRIESKAAFIRYLADRVPGSQDAPAEDFFSGLGEVLREIEEMAQSIRRSLDSRALGRELNEADEEE
jgi:hypothetical protein